jgi:flagellar protein FlaG
VNLQISFSGNNAASKANYLQAPMIEAKPIVNYKNEVARIDREGSAIATGEQQLVRSIDRAIKAMQGPETTVEVSVHEKTQAIMVKVLDKSTGEIIREIPHEQTLEIVAKMMELAGLIIDERG